MSLPSDDATAVKPIPAPDNLTKQFWAHARAHELAVQYCDHCDFFIHTPRNTCPQCDGHELRFQVVSGRGTLYSYTVMYDAPAPAFAGVLPYIVGIVELEEQPRLLMAGNVLDCPADTLRIGMPVTATFEDLDATDTQNGSAERIALIHFRPIGD